MSFQTVDEAIEALLGGSVRGVLLDTYVAGSSTKLQASQTFRISKIIERSTGYGMVLSGDAVVLKKPIDDFLAKHREWLFRVVESNAKALQVSTNEVLRSVMLFQAVRTLLRCHNAGHLAAGMDKIETGQLVE